MKIKAILLNIGLSLGTILFSLLIFELLLRLFGNQDIYTVSSYEKKMYDLESNTGLRPGFQGSFLNSEIQGTIKINDKGLRDGNKPYLKGENTCRILGLGDSFTFGHGVEFEESFLSILESQLIKGDQGIEIVKAGVPGIGLDEYLKILKLEGLKYQPDMVLVNVFIGNDIYYTTIPSDTLQQISEGISKEKDRDIQVVKTWLRRNLHVYSFVVDRLKSVPSIRKVLSSSNIATGVIGTYVIDILRVEYDESYQMKWRRAEEIFKEMKSLCPNLILVIIPTREQIEENRRLQALKQLGYKADMIDVFKPNEMLNDICLRNQIGLIDLTDEMIRSFKLNNHSAYFEIDPHFNEKGHAIAASVIADHLFNKYSNGQSGISICNDD